MAVKDPIERLARSQQTLGFNRVPCRHAVEAMSEDHL